MRFRTPSGDRLFRLASGLLRGARDAPGLSKAMSAYLGSAEAEAGAGGEFRAACGPGCPHCCVLNISVLLPEAASIAHRLARERTVGELAAFMPWLDNHRRRVRWMETGERIRLGIRCPFLDARDRCEIHPYRPMACRGVTSPDPELCRAALDPGDPDAPGPVPMDMRRKMAMEDAYVALAAAMEDRGMESRCIELAAGVGAFLADPRLVDLLLTGGPFPPGPWE